MKFMAAHDGGADYDFVVASLEKTFKSQGIIPPMGSFESQLHVPVRPVCVIFGRPACKIFKDELLPDRNYYNLRSGQNVELFYMGYANPDEDFLDAGEFDENDFSELAFVSAVEDFEARTKWTYSGQTDVIILNAFFSPHAKVHLDFSNVFIIQLEHAVDSKLIRSGRSLIEEIMHQSKDRPSSDIVNKVSDVVFLKNARQTFLSWIMGLLKLKAEDLSNAYASTVRDISRTKSPA